MNGATNYELFNSLEIDIDKKLETIQKRLENVRSKAKDNNQIYEQKVTATVLNEDLAQMSDEKREAMEALRDFAIQELEQEGAFK